MAFLCDLANGGPNDKASKFQDKVSRNAVDYSQPQAGKDLTSCIQLKVKRNSEDKKHRNTIVPALLGIEPNTNSISPPNKYLQQQILD
ncbi:hypothetical protein HO133_002273 [Letharia lupina]|uniref:Uncharacterized protein n=1 Tax=Letharia lupina TaxID=560253 RepID=A0A8H6FB52_9LECA|nr:uncharacterized protein HO133_002273 [Letharia lupina]KAF6221418.1 hypothetical protein HO133_002273 [Letharia lupina]